MNIIDAEWEACYEDKDNGYITYRGRSKHYELSPFKYVWLLWKNLTLSLLAFLDVLMVKSHKED